MSAWRERVEAEALTWNATPYHHEGAIKSVGVDCARLLCEVYHAAGLIPAIDPRPYPPDWHMHRDEPRFMNWVLQYATLTDKKDKGNLVLFKYGRAHSHGAIILTWPRVIHAVRQARQVVIEDLSLDMLTRDPLVFTFEAAS